jgi:hypothetical protein
MVQRPTMDKLVCGCVLLYHIIVIIIPVEMLNWSRNWILVIAQLTYNCTCHCQSVEMRLEMSGSAFGGYRGNSAMWHVPIYPH